MIIDGKQIAEKILDDVTSKVKELSYKPLFCDILVGDDQVSASYVRLKGLAAERVGFAFDFVHMPTNTSTEELVEKITDLQNEPTLAGLIVQLPLPDHLDLDKVLKAIDPSVDVDCIGTESNTAFYQDKTEMIPPTAGAILHILDTLPEDLSEKRVLVIGQGELVGKPITHLLKKRGLQVTIADRRTENLAVITPYADVIICGTGQPGLLYGSMVKPGAIVIDAGTAESGGGIVGDVEFESVLPVASCISPVPGGVGPVTVAKLLENVYLAAKAINIHP